MADCMECDDDIDWDVDVCPHCGLDAPVARKWYFNLYEEKVNVAKKADDLFRDLVQQWEIAELLTCLEQDEECQSRAGAETLCQGQRRFFLGRTITSVQLLVAQRMWKPGIGGAVDRGHVEPAFLSSGGTENPSETG